MTRTSPASSESSDDPRLDAVIAEHLRRKDAGESVDEAALLEAYPELADGLRSYFEGDAMMNRLAGLDRENAGQRDPEVPAEEKVTVMPGALDQTATHTGERPFGRYQVLRQLGEGAMGSVYLAEDTSLHRQVALKIPKLGSIDDVDFRQRFYREARAAAGLVHPGICSVFDVNEHEGTLFMTMQYIDGQPLSRFVGTAHFQSVDAVLALIQKIAEAVGHAHENGIVHRDLKPANILVDDQRRPYVTDFGLARRVEQDDESRITREGHLLGTPAYMAPEQAAGRQDEIGPASDIYALGVILFELLTARLPFEGTTPAILAAALRDKPPRPGSLRPDDLDDEVDELCLSMLAKAPQSRPQSMREVANQITRIRKQLAQTSPQSAGQTSMPELKKKRRQIEAAVAAGRYTDAIRELEQMVILTDPSVRSAVAWARKKLKEVKAQRHGVDPEAMAELLNRARDAFDRQDFEACAEILRQVPEGERPDDFHKVLDEAIRLQEECEAIESDVRQLVKQRRFRQAGERLEDLLKVSPCNQYAKHLKQKLQSYERVPAVFRRYRLDARGDLKPLNEDSPWTRWAVLSAVVGLLVFSVMSYAITVYIKRNGQTVAKVTVPDDGTETIEITVDGRSRNAVSSSAETPSDQERIPWPVPVSWPAAEKPPRTPLPDGQPGLVMTYPWQTEQGTGVSEIEIAPNGRTLAAAGAHAARVWDLETGAEIKDLWEAGSWGVEFSADSHFVYFHTPQSLRRYEMADGRDMLSFDTVDGNTQSLSLSSDEELIASHLTESGGICLWDTDTGRLIKTIENGPGDWGSAAFVPGTHHILTHAMFRQRGPEEFGLRLIDAANDRLIRKYESNGKPCVVNVPSLPVSPDGSLFLLVTNWGTQFAVVDIESGEFRTDITVPEDGERINAVEFLPDGRHVVMARGTEIGIWNPSTRQKVHSFTLPFENTIVQDIEVSPDGRFAFTACRVKPKTVDAETLPEEFDDLHVWRLPRSVWPASVEQTQTQDVDRRAVLTTTLPMRGSVSIRDIGVSPDGRFTVAITASKAVRVWDSIDERKVSEVMVPTVPWCVEFDRNGRDVLVGTKDGLYVFDGPAGEGVRRVAVGAGNASQHVYAMAQEPAGNLIALYLKDRIEIHETGRSERLVQTIMTESHSSPRGLAFSPDGRILYAADETNGLRTYSGADWTETRYFKNAESDRPFAVYHGGISLSPAGDRLAACVAIAGEPAVVLLDTETGAILSQIPMSGTPRFISDGTEVLIGFGQSLALWSSDGRRVWSISHEHHIFNRLALPVDRHHVFSAGGTYWDPDAAAMVSEDVGDVFVWKLP